MNENNFLILKQTKLNRCNKIVTKKKFFYLYNKISFCLFPFFFIYIIFLLLNKKKYIREFKKNQNIINTIINNIKICICTLGKDENKYIKEFVDYYKNYGVDKIILNDNNDIEGERFEEVIGEYITLIAS